MVKDDKDDIARMFAKLDVDTTMRPEFREELRQRMLDAYDERARQKRAGSTASAAGRRWRIATGRRGVSIAAAAVALLGVGAWMIFTGSLAVASVSFGKILEEVRKVRGVTYTATFHEHEKDQPRYEVRVMVAEPGRIRWIMPDGRIQIVDLRHKREITIWVAQKKATTMTAALGAREQYDPLETLRRLHATSGEFVDKKELDGRLTNVFRAHRESQTITVWADPETNLPVQVEFAWRSQKGTNDPMQGSIKITMRKFAWDVELPESLFSLKPPPGYVLATEYDAVPTEADLLEALRICAKLSDGTFPTALNKRTVAKLMFNWLRRDKPESTRRTVFGTKTEVRAARVDKATERLADAMRRGLMFVQRRTQGGNDWHYSGRGVKLGDVNAPVCWWRPQGSTTYRVVYGDLSVKTAGAGELPTPSEIPETRPSRR